MYKIVGADKKEYGPVSNEQLRTWITQGRANAQTLVSFEGGPWKPLHTFPDIAALLPPAVPPIQASNYPGATRKNNLAAVGLVMSILGLTCCPALGSVIGIVCGSISYSQIKEDPERFSTSKNVALAAIILGMVGIIVQLMANYSGAYESIYRSIRGD